MSIKEIIGFTDCDSFYKEYVPLSPYGLLSKNEYPFFTDKNLLSSIYDSLALIVDFIKDKTFESDKIENHFKKIGLLNSLEKKTFDSADIFLIKKLLFNYKTIVSHLDQAVKDQLQINFYSNDLLSFLSPDGKNKETFYLDSSYNEKLAEIRTQLLIKDKAITELKKERFTEISEQLGLDFRFRDFIILKEELLSQVGEGLLYKEVYDKTSLLVKPVFSKAYFDLVKEKDILLKEELELEKEVIGEISKRILEEKELIKGYIQKIEKLDTLFAKARLAIKYQMTKPILEAQENIEVINGSYLPLAHSCEKLGTTYTPLSVSFDNKCIVITGSNMGGKTMFLKTIAFMQLLSQMGFWVPAQLFRTKVFENISYIGGDLTAKVEGLSSFGFEIHNLSNAINDFDKNTLLLMDEFAKTTNSIEAKALIAGMLKSFSQNEKVFTFLSTHFMELPAFENVSFYKMKGLNYSEYKKYYDKKKQYTLSERIKLINAFMQFEVIKTSNEDRTYDAVSIADTLGLSEEILIYTKEYLKGHN